MVVITGMCHGCRRFKEEENSFPKYSCKKSLSSTYSNVMVNHRYRLRTNLTWPGFFNRTVEVKDGLTVETFECTECLQFKNKR